MPLTLTVISMQTEHLVTVATVLALTWAMGTTFVVAVRGRVAGLFAWFALLCSYAGLVGVLWVDSLTNLGRNSAVYLWTLLSTGDPHHLCAAGLGFSAGLGPACWLWMQRRRTPATMLDWIQSVGSLVSLPLALIFLGLLAFQEDLKPLLVHRPLVSVIADPVIKEPPNFAIEELIETDIHPVQIAVGPDDCLYATGYRGLALQDGVVIRISAEKGGQYTARTAARGLGRPHGLACFGGDLYVSRSGQFARAKAGILEFENTGAVTLLRDLDGDGRMDFYDDVLAGLPGAQGPDPLHQNNGIAFAPDGRLFVTVGRHTDRGPACGELAGTIISLRPGEDTPEAFAHGLRNPFDLAFGPDGQLFCTDNDANDRRSGDELNHVTKDDHFGFPYTHGTEAAVEGAAKPILVRQRGSLQGLTYADSPALPPELRNCLYAVSYGNSEILQIRLTPQGDTFKTEVSVFARIPGAVDIVADRAGNFYVSCFQTRKIYRLRYQGRQT